MEELLQLPLGGIHLSGGELVIFGICILCFDSGTQQARSALSRDTKGLFIP